MPDLTPAYESLFKELSNNEKYSTYSVYDFYVKNNGKAEEKKVNVVIRIDVDSAFHLCPDLAKHLKKYNLNSTFYFLTHPDRYYKIWDSDIPRQVYKTGAEVGLHYDHYYEELKYNKDGRSELKKDIKKLSALIKTPIKGMVAHGHPAMNALGKSNWELVKHIPSEDLCLSYHDNIGGKYIAKESTVWKPRSDINITDFLGFPHSWGWNYIPNIPISKLKTAKKGDIVHIAFHTKNAFYYWKNWETKYGEKKLKKESIFSFLKKKIYIFFDYKLKLTQRMVKLLKRIYTGSLYIFSIFITYFFAVFTKRKNPRDNSNETGREQIWKKPLDFWLNHLKNFGVLQKIQKNSNILEVGSGNGQWIIALSKICDNIIGIDPFRECIDYSKSKIKEFSVEDKVKVYKEYAEAIPFENNSFDLVLCLGVFMFTKQKQSLREMQRVLKPEGLLVLTINGLGYFFMNIKDGIKGRDYKRAYYGVSGLVNTLLKWIVRKDIPYTTAVNVTEMKKLLEKNNFSLLQWNLWTAQNLYPLKHFGFPTNYVFIAQKKC